jgi:hypothetical protein
MSVFVSYEDGRYAAYQGAPRTLSALHAFLMEDARTLSRPHSLPVREPFWYAWQLAWYHRVVDVLVRTAMHVCL